MRPRVALYGGEENLGKNAAVRGLDIGPVNAIRNGEFLPVFPFVNFSF
jgi:hypothetical protein